MHPLLHSERFLSAKLKAEDNWELKKEPLRVGAQLSGEGCPSFNPQHYHHHNENERNIPAVTVKTIILKIIVNQVSFSLKSVMEAGGFAPALAANLYFLLKSQRSHQLPKDMSPNS